MLMTGESYDRWKKNGYAGLRHPRDAVTRKEGANFRERLKTKLARAPGPETERQG